MAKIKIPSYFCEACGTKVDKMAPFCPVCKKVFDSIKCPMCSYNGKAHEFPNGCPVCGFMSAEQKKALNKRKIASSKSGYESGKMSLGEERLYKILIGISLVVCAILIAVFYYNIK